MFLRAKNGGEDAFWSYSGVTGLDQCPEEWLTGAVSTQIRVITQFWRVEKRPLVYLLAQNIDSNSCLCVSVCECIYLWEFPCVWI